VINIIMWIRYTGCYKNPRGLQVINSGINSNLNLA
jgi:hypothetical protein